MKNFAIELNLIYLLINKCKLFKFKNYLKLQKMKMIIVRTFKTDYLFVLCTNLFSKK